MDDIINKQVEEFRQKFCWNEGLKWDEEGKPTKYKKTLYTNRDQIEAIEAHLRSSMKKVGEEIVKKIEKELKLYPTTGQNYWAEVNFHDWDKLKVSLTDKGE